MKETSTFYVLAVACGNAFLGWAFTRLMPVMRATYASLCGLQRDDLCSFTEASRMLPPVTAYALAFSTWPICLAAIASAFLLVSLFTKISSHFLCHVVILILALDVVFLSVTMLGLLIPLVNVPSVKIQ